MGDILSITKKVLDLMHDEDLSRVQCIFVCEAVKMSIQEEMTKDIIEDSKKGHDEYAGVR